MGGEEGVPFLTNDPKYKDVVYFGIMRCPKCGYETTVTNIHRSCPKTPADQELTRMNYCYTHKTFHYKPGPNGKTVWLGHRSVVMVYSGYVGRFGKRKRRYKPKDEEEKQKLRIGWGVVFEK